jgi:hypothetical protein
MPFLPSVQRLKCCAAKRKHKLKIYTNRFLPHCRNFSPEIIRVTLFVFTRPCVHIYFIVYHIRGAHIYPVSFGCFNPFTATVRFVPKEFTLKNGVFAACKIKSVLFHLSHCRRNSHSPVLSFLTSYSKRNCVLQLNVPSLLVRGAPQALVNKPLQEV